MTIHVVLLLLTWLLLFRIIIVKVQRGWVLRYLDAVFEKYIEEERLLALKEFPDIPEEEHDEFWENVEKKMSHSKQLWTMYDLYPDTITMALSLDKWTYHQLFPMLYLNTSLVLSGKIDEIDLDLLE